MLIECTIKREGGSLVTMGQERYHFKPTDPADPHSPHVCAVSNNDHAKRLLRIKEAYAPAGDVDASVAADLKQDQDNADAEKAEATRLADSMSVDMIPVSDETQVEIAEALDKLMADLSESKKKDISTADDLLVKEVSQFFEEQSALNSKSKTDIVRFAAGCDITVDSNESPARMIKDLLNALLKKTDPEEGSDLGSEADDDEHAKSLTAGGDAGGEGEDEGDDEGDDE